jgi:hypothetical protein
VGAIPFDGCVSDCRGAAPTWRRGRERAVAVARRRIGYLRLANCCEVVRGIKSPATCADTMKAAMANGSERNRKI